MTFAQFCFAYWWLIFPLFGMLMGILGMLSHHHHRSETLRLLKSYADQGKEPPQFLLDAIKSDEERAYDHGYGRRRYYRRYRGYGYGWGKVAVFGALAAGFGFAGYYGDHGPHTVFLALALGFGVAATLWLVLGIGNALFGPKPRDFDPRDDDEHRDR